MKKICNAYLNMLYLINMYYIFYLYVYLDKRLSRIFLTTQL